ncbi:MAG: PLP-dependent aminotransferase family protein [Candidatus Zixiibacteriota bacterium]
MLVEEDLRVRVERWQVAPHVVDLETSIIREILKISSQPGVISFAGGLPAPELFPLDELKVIAVRVLDTYMSDSLQYSLSRGITPLRESIATLASTRGTPTSIDNILITCGAQQAIELVARAFIDRGDYILTEYPTYVGALQAFNYYQARYVAVEMDNEGMIVDQVEEKLRKFRPKLIYTVSNFQNPTGITMSEERRRQLVAIAARFDIPIVDDNPYGDIRFEGERVPTLKSLGGDQVIAIRTFSKVLAPGLRVGWMNGPVEVMPQFEKVKQCTDLHTNTFAQYLIYEWLKDGNLDPHVARLAADYGAKRDLMLDCLEEHFPQEATWTRPEGGLFIWIELPKHISAKALLPQAVERKVAYVYGQPFFPDGQGLNCMRLNFSNASHDDVRTGIARLGELLKEQI